MRARSEIFLFGGSDEFVLNTSLLDPSPIIALPGQELTYSLTQWCCRNFNDVTLADDSSVMKIPNQYLLLILIEALLFMLMKLQMLLTTDDALKRPLTYDPPPKKKKERFIINIKKKKKERIIINIIIINIFRYISYIILA